MNYSRLIVIALALVIFLPSPTSAQQIVPQPKDITFTPEVPIPGVFDEPQTVDENFTARYVRGIYVYFIWIVGVLATSMVIYGGIKWVAASGNPSQINAAREVINNAIIGVIIALLSVVILNLISPQFTSLGLPQIAGVKPITAVFSKYNATYDCYENVACPADYTQTMGGQCGNAGVFTHVNPGQIPCGTRSGTFAICCRKNDGSLCVGLSSKDGKQTDSGKCNTVTQAPASLNAACPDQTACGAYDPGRGCRGIYAGPNQLCYIKDGNSSGVKINPGVPGASTKYTFTGLTCGSGSGTLFFTNALPCGQHKPAVYDSQNVTVWGTQSTCGANQYCRVQEPVGDAANQCITVAGTVCSSYEVL